MRFRNGDIVQHILTSERMIVIGTHEAVLSYFTNSVTNIYDCRIGGRLDLIYHFDELELKEIGMEKI